MPRWIRWGSDQQEASIGFPAMSEQTHRTLIELSPDALIIHDGQIVILANSAMARLIGARSVGDMIGLGLRDFIAPTSWALVEERIQAMNDLNPTSTVDETWRRIDGSEVRVEVAATPMPWIGPRAAMVIARDVTERRRLEAERETLLAEKELLIREVHHRVVNSLQLVQSLLRLQARHAVSRDVQIQLYQASARIGTIGILHHRLHKDGSAVEGEVRDYIEGVMEDLRTVLGEAYERPILLETGDVRPLVLKADFLVTLGLVAAEAISNALEHGDGPIRVRLSKSDAGLELSVEDDGPGFPRDFDPAANRRGLGMRVMTSLVETRGGRIVIGSRETDAPAPASRIVLTLPL